MAHESYAAILPYQRVHAGAHGVPSRSTWKPMAEPMIVPLEDILCVFIWFQLGESVVVLHPLALYGK